MQRQIEANFLPPTCPKEVWMVTYRILNVDGMFRGKHHTGLIIRGLKFNTVFGNICLCKQRYHLISTTVLKIEERMNIYLLGLFR